MYHSVPNGDGRKKRIFRFLALQCLCGHRALRRAGLVIQELDLHAKCDSSILHEAYLNASKASFEDIWASCQRFCIWFYIREGINLGGSLNVKTSANLQPDTDTKETNVAVAAADL